MKPFILNIDQYRIQQLELGLRLNAFSVLNYPIYCIHSRIIDSTPDSLEKLDSFIVRCLVSGMDNATIERLSAISDRILNERKTELVNSQLLTQDERHFQLTKKGEQIFLNGTQARKQIKSYDFYLDGINFDPLPAYFYRKEVKNVIQSEDDILFSTNRQGEKYSIRTFQSDVCHTPPDEDLIRAKVFAVEQSERKNFEIPEELLKVKELSFSKLSYPLLIAHLYNEDGDSIKKFVNGYSHYGDDIDFSFFYKNIETRVKNKKIEIFKKVDPRTNKNRYHLKTNWDEIDSKENIELCIKCSIQDLIIHLNRVYNLNLGEKDIEISKTKIVVHISEFNFKDSRRKIQILTNLERGRDYIHNNPSKYGVWLLFLEFVTEDQFILDLLKIRKEIDAIDDPDEVNGVLTKYNYSKRKIFVSIERFDLLELINIKKYMTI